MTDEKTRIINTPYVSFSLLKVAGGRSPKTEISIKISGAIEELNLDDVSSTLDALSERIVQQLKYTEKDLDQNL